MNETLATSLLQLVYRQSKRIRIPAILAISFIGYFLSISTSGHGWILWMSVSTSVYLMRPLVMLLITKNTLLSIRRKLVVTGAYSALGGLSMSNCIVLFPQLDLSERAVVSLILAGFGAGGSGTNAGYSPLFLCFIIPLLMPLGIVWMMNPGSYLDSAVAMVIGSLILMMIGVLTMLGRDTFATFSAYIELSEKQVATTKALTEALQAAELDQQRAESSNRSKTRFLAAASHDLRQPVHVVSLYGAALETIAKERRIAAIVKDMNVAIDSLSAQLNALLDVSQLDSGVVKPDFQALNLTQVVNSVVDEFKLESESQGTRLINNLKKLVYVQSDSMMLTQILRNVVGNAVKFTPRGQVVLSLVDHGHRVTLSCRDSGLGMSESEQQCVFEEFYQVDNPARDRTNGLGLGLSIVDRLARCLSHELHLESTLGVGTCISLQLVKVGAEPVPIGYEEASHPSAGSSVSDTTLHLWAHVVDDEIAVRQSMTLLLGELGCRTTETGSTEETVDFLETNRPDIVFVDLRLRGGDSGMKTLEAIKRIDAGLEPVVVTGETFFRSNALNLDEGLTVLYKPVGKAKLIEALMKVRARSKYATENRKEISGIDFS